MMKIILFQSKKCNLGLQSFVIVFLCTTEPILSTSPLLPKNQLELLKYWKSMIKILEEDTIGI